MQTQTTFKLEKLNQEQEFLEKCNLVSLLYHNIFDYPLTSFELAKWMPGKKAMEVRKQNFSGAIEEKEGYYFIKGRQGLVYKRIIRERISDRKRKIAQNASRILSLIPTINLAAVTGALAMNNCDQDSDIDLLIICKKGTLWSTRLVGLLLLTLFGFSRRKFGDKIQKDKLCLNMWLDGTVLGWPKNKRNIYTAHEIAQTLPLLNRDKTHQRFIWANRWIKNYWPNAVKIRNKRFENSNFKILKIVLEFVLRASNLIAYRMQYLYMKPKITKEIISARKAIFHPNDWSEIILNRLNITN